MQSLEGQNNILVKLPDIDLQKLNYTAYGQVRSCLIYSLNDEEWGAFQAALDAPPSTHPRLQQLLNTPSVFVGEACT